MITYIDDTCIISTILSAPVGGVVVLWAVVYRQGSEWHKYRTEFGKKLLGQTEVNRLVGPINHVTDDFIGRLRQVRDRDGDLAVVNRLAKDVHNWSMEGQ